ncbi:MAG: hypothetical protein VXX69_01820, partial [Pseudomonadota bacterium]|nr:hypothetical protein [Pseudomonadota bacterium]
WTAKPSEDASAARREPEVDAPMTPSAQAGSAEVAEAPARQEAPAILDLPRADAMNRVPEQASTTALDQQADDLEIPAFLRRQAN